MQWNIPGTVLMSNEQETEHIEDTIRGMFLGGGIALSQVAAVTGLEPYTIQNWVKRGFLTPPVGKRYSLDQLCRIISINMLKSALPLEDICGLLRYVNGQLDDNSDDLIDDATFYFLFLKLAAQHRRMNLREGRDTAIASALEGYEEPIPGAKGRVEKVLRIMLAAWAASMLRQTAERMIAELKA